MHCCDIIRRITEWQKSDEFLVFTEVKDSPGDLVEVALREKVHVYKYLEAC